MHIISNTFDSIFKRSFVGRFGVKEEEGITCTCQGWVRSCIDGWSRCGCVSLCDANGAEVDVMATEAHMGRSALGTA